MVTPFLRPPPKLLSPLRLLTAKPNCGLTHPDFVPNEVLNIIDTVTPMEPALDKVSHFLSSQAVASVIREQRKPELGFQFFIWTTNKKHFCSWDSHNLIIDMLAGHFDLYWKTLGEVKNFAMPICSDAFAVLISAYWKLNKAEMAVECFGRMKDFNCKANPFTYNGILHVMVHKAPSSMEAQNPTTMEARMDKLEAHMVELSREIDTGFQAIQEKLRVELSNFRDEVMEALRTAPMVVAQTPGLSSIHGQDVQIPSEELVKMDRDSNVVKTDPNVEENNAGKALEALKEIQSKHATVIRMGNKASSLPAKDVVLGDIVELKVRDKVPTEY